MSTVLLRYTGHGEKSFTEHGVGEVRHGSEFDVPEAEAERYLRRADVELATPEASVDSSDRQDADTSGAGRAGRRGRSGGSNGKNDSGGSSE